MVKNETLPGFIKKEFEDLGSEFRVFKARGCSHCQAGYKGRTVIAEILEFDDEARDMVSSGKLDLLRHKAEKEAYPSLRYDAAMLILRGVTSLEEAERVVG